ncbi:family 20 glycosylhydrolase [Sabulilitoribacter arenilitoris]|uniref:Family 20 glycosylhydrolase n=1 Tax=Wocania arenilitoris TaxID=2044858 RepID=A0AAE3EN33_9FLAO|nr:glycoside hydrolase family 20 protein [Wocania arenilitoris]MCF7568453.1 family 20 glycosylhydrolase [Wocania arenilitoris]
MKKIIFLMILIGSLNQINSQEPLTVVPAIQEWTDSLTKSYYDCITIIYSKNINSNQKLLLERFREELKDIGLKVKNKPNKSSIDIYFDINYIKEISKKDLYKINLGKQTHVTAASYNGMLYATRTLLQLFSQKKYHKSIPNGYIVDYSSYEKRMLLIDVARKFFSIEELKDYIRAMAWVKMNEFHIHLSDNSGLTYGAYRLESNKYPRLTSIDGHYSWKEIRELQDFAHSYGITITPEIDSPGHSLAFTNVRPDLKSPWLTAKYLDITNKDVYPFVEEILDEVIPHFDAPDFHLGTDEYRIKSIKNDSLKIHLGETFRKYINHFNKVVKKYNKTTRIWSGYEHMPGHTEVDKDIIIDMWETNDSKNKSENGYQFINSGHYFTYIVPGAPYYGVKNKFIYEKWTPEYFSHNEDQNLSKESPGLLGSKLHIWNDYGPSGYTISEISRLSIPSMMVFSEKMWGTKAYDSIEEFNKVMSSLMKIPQTKFLSRSFSKDKILYKSARLIDLEHKPFLKLKSKTKNVEYPWKLKLTLKRASTSLDNQVLLSSRWATVYANLEHVFTDRDKKITKRGIGIVRANKSEGVTPLTSLIPKILVFDYQLPINKSVEITIVGKKGETSLYADGKLIGSENIQMLCPMKFFGSAIEESFSGVIEKIEIKQEAGELVEK